MAGIRTGLLTPTRPPGGHAPDGIGPGGGRQTARWCLSSLSWGGAVARSWHEERGRRLRVAGRNARSRFVVDRPRRRPRRLVAVSSLGLTSSRSARHAQQPSRLAAVVVRRACGLVPVLGEARRAARPAPRTQAGAVAPCPRAGAMERMPRRSEAGRSCVENLECTGSGEVPVCMRVV